MIDVINKHHALRSDAEKDGEDTPRFRQWLREAHAECVDRGTHAQTAAREYDPTFTIIPYGWWNPDGGSWTYVFVVEADMTQTRFCNTMREQGSDWEKALEVASSFKLPFDSFLGFEVDVDPNGPM